MIGRRLERLSDRCNETLAVASVIGREFGLDELERLIDDLSEDRLLEVLEEALSARVIEELPRALGRYQFTHALIQETLAEELSLTRKVRLHARIAEALRGALRRARSTSTRLSSPITSERPEALLGPDKLVRVLAHRRRGLRWSPMPPSKRFCTSSAHRSREGTERSTTKPQRSWLG